VLAVHRSANLQIQLGNAQARVQAHAHEANLSTHDRTKPSCRGLRADYLFVAIISTFPEQRVQRI